MKHYSFFNHILFLSAFIVLISSCKKDPDEPEPDQGPQTGTLGLHFESVILKNDGTELDLELSSTSGSSSPDGQPKYETANGDSITFTAVRYWISNITLMKAGGEEYVVPDSYHLIQRWGSLIDEKFNITNVPNGTYTGMKFYIGIDSATNGYVYGGKGELSVGIGMNWDSQPGYIFSKAEGQYQKGDGTWDSYAYHIGKLGNSIYKPDSPIILNFNDDITINGNHPRVHLKTNVNAIFGLAGVSGSTILDVKILNQVYGTTEQNQIADNWRSGMFMYDHMHDH